jgi:hypothetical protein
VPPEGTLYIEVFFGGTSLFVPLSKAQQLITSLISTTLCIRNQTKDLLVDGQQRYVDDVNLAIATGLSSDRAKDIRSPQNQGTRLCQARVTHPRGRMSYCANDVVNPPRCAFLAETQ